MPDDSHNDIANWQPSKDAFADLIQKSGDDKMTHHGISRHELTSDPLRVFALLKHFIAPKPNGFYTFLIKDKPLDNPIWWDFVLEHEGTVLHIVRTNSVLEAWVLGVGLIDVQDFIDSNLERYSPEVELEVKNFERHLVFINHYRSYQRCVDFLWSEIEPIDDMPPEIPPGHIRSEEEIQEEMARLETFTQASIKLHVLGKSLILNAAFMVESFATT